jgi:hypothetical protein
VDPDEKLTLNSNSGKVVGTPLTKPDGGGHVIAEIVANNVGAADQKRWFIADFGKASGAETVYVVCDTSDNGKFWQLCTYEANKITTEGNVFTITAENDSTMKGTVLYPAAPRFKVGQRPRGSDFGSKKNNTFVHCQSDDGCYLVVLTCTKKGGAQPAVSATGTWGKSPNGTVKVGGFSVTLKGDEISY